MKIGQKVIRVQKLMMTKADVQAMAEQGKLELKGSKVVVKNAPGGILDINKLSKLAQSPISCVDDNPTMQGTNPREVRTYVKKLVKKEDYIVERGETEMPIVENVNIDVQESDSQETNTVQEVITI